MERDRSPVLEDYWQEFSSFGDGHQEDEDEDISKTPDEGEAEEEWLREVGFENLVDTELMEQDQVDCYDDLLSTLTARQIAVVKKKLETVQMSKKRRHPAKQRADVRDVFNQGPEVTSDKPKDPIILSAPTRDSHHGESRSLFKSASSENSDRPPYRGGRLEIPFLRSGHSGGFKLKDHSGAIDSESPTSVEVLRYEIRHSVQEGQPYYTDFSLENKERPSGDVTLETGFQEISSRLPLVKESTDLGDEYVSYQWPFDYQRADLTSEDRCSVRSLALIEVSALLDNYGLVSSRRKTTRKKVKESAVFGTPLTTLLELDQRRCPGCKIPLIFQWILHHLHAKALKEEGLLRLGGSVQKTEALKSEIERSYMTSPTIVENAILNASVHDVAVILKQLVRYLPEPLLTSRHMGAFLQVPNIPNIQDQINILNLLVLVLPDAHRETLQELLYFLGRVVEEEQHNRMTLQNVAMIMAPNLFPPKVKKGNLKNDLAAEVTIAALSSKVTQLLIKYRHFLGFVPPELLAQARLQKRRTSGDKSAKRPNGKKAKADKIKTIKEDIASPATVIRVHISSLRMPSIPVHVDERTTAGDVVERVAEALDHMMEPMDQENRGLLQRPRTTSEPIVIRHKCLLGARKPLDCRKDHFLYQIRENLVASERALDHSSNVLAIARTGPGSLWEVRCHH